MSRFGLQTLKSIPCQHSREGGPHRASGQHQHFRLDRHSDLSAQCLFTENLVKLGPAEEGDGTGSGWEGPGDPAGRLPPSP